MVSGAGGGSPRSNPDLSARPVDSAERDPRLGERSGPGGALCPARRGEAAGWGAGRSEPGRRPRLPPGGPRPRLGIDETALPPLPQRPNKT